ncbi:WD40 repeat domain-containing serine/threonine protein kinase [Planctomycetes bacterium K23_9]|uniref:Serine/threonine-protein kinase PrkC n=1 Tax=Stieleria marina TaxID=1930275 RepID=A0A517NZM0_9BACT|nr:Serine/threonine-protein kinase PrkC [Planctomycetes bacterium K23_9]
MDSECPVCNHSFDDGPSSRLGRTLSIANDDDVVDKDLTLVSCPSCGTLLSEDADDGFSLETEAAGGEPRQFAHFELQRVLGQGGFGTVWLAKDTRLDRSVAVKLPVRRRGTSKSLVREAKTAAKLQHPNIVTVHEVGEFEGQVFIVCEYVSGLDLRSYLSKGLPPQARVVDLLQGIASGLHHAHENQIVHRDMKPGNVLVDDAGVPLVADFGLAKVVSVEESISSRGKVVGTILYMAPEQAGQEVDQVDRRADVYAMGVMMYEMLTGERPYRGNVQAVLHQKSNEDPTPLRQLRTSVPLDLETICLKCLQRAPGRRYQTADEFCDELQRFKEGKPILARPVSRIEKAWRWCQRNRMTASLTTLFLSSLLIGLAGTTTFWLEARKQTLQANRSLYASQMSMAASHLGVGDIEATRSTLDRYNTTGLKYLRGFEWRYLAAKLNRFEAVTQHGRRVKGLAVSRDGDWWASIADDRFLRVFEFESAKSIREIPFHAGRWQAVAISHADNRVAAGAKDGSVYVWDSISDESKLPTIFKHGVGVQVVRFSGDGKRLFSSGASGAVRVWEVGTWKLVSEIPTGREGLVALDASFDGSVLATIGSEGVIRVWDVDAKNMRFAIRDGRSIQSVALSPSGDRLVAGTRGGYLLMHETIDGTPLFNLNTRFDWISGIRFLGKSSLVALCSSKGVVAIFDLETHQEISDIQTHYGVEGLLDVSKNGSRMAVGSAKGILRTIDTSDFQRALMIGSDEPIFDIDFLSSQEAVATYRDGSIKKLNFEKRTVDLLFKSSDRRPMVSASEQNSVVAIGSAGLPVQLMSSSGKSVATIAELDVDEMTFSQSGKLLIISRSGGPIVGYSIDLNRKQVAKELFSLALPVESDISEQPKVVALALSGDSQQLAVSFSHQQIRVAELSRLEWQNARIALDASGESLVMAGDKIVVGTRGGEVICFDQSAMAELWKIKAYVNYVNDLIRIPGGNAIASVGDSNAIAIWDLENGDSRIRLHRDEHQLFSIAASADGSTMLSAGIDGDARIWRTEH